MEETLTNYLIYASEDFSYLKSLREYLDIFANTPESCSLTRCSIDTFGAVLSKCLSQNSPKTEFLDILLDSFHCLVKNNGDLSVWEKLGHELGMITVKILSIIERCETFEALFCKLLSVICLISEHSTKVWKATARQILNVLINKKYSLFNFENILKLYISTLKLIDGDTLYEFSLQNLQLLKSLSLIIRNIGDFEIQSDVMELVFLHLSNNSKLMCDIFTTSDKALPHPLQFSDFEGDCRLYLNKLNKAERSLEKRVYSVCCAILYLGGCSAEPPIGRNVFWVDANRDSERVSMKSGDVDSNTNRIICIHFSEIKNVQLEANNGDQSQCLKLQTKSLKGLGLKLKSDDICLITSRADEVGEFFNFLKTTINQKKKLEKKVSKTRDSLLVDRNCPKETQSSADTNSKASTEQVLPDFGSVLHDSNKEIKFSHKEQYKSHTFSPKLFVEDLNQHTGSESPGTRHTFENSVETMEFIQRTNPQVTHKLFRSPNELFEIPILKSSNNFNFVVDENKENDRSQCFSVESSTSFLHKPAKVDIEKEVITESQDHFRENSYVRRKKPSLPRLKRSAKLLKKGKEKEKENSKKLSIKPASESFNNGLQMQTRDEETNDENIRPSLLDPDGYAFRRWCKPSTSERSSFWMKKLKMMEKTKTESDIFEFSEELNSVFDETENKKRRVVHLKQRRRTKKEVKKTSLNRAKTVLKNSCLLTERENARSKSWVLPQLREPRDSSNKLPVDFDRELSFLGQNEPPSFPNNCRSIPPISIQSEKEIVPKKTFASVLTNFPHRLQKLQNKDRVQVQEITEAVSKFSDRLFNYFWQKDGEKLRSYFSSVETVAPAFNDNIEQLEICSIRLQRAILYFKTGCTVKSCFESCWDGHLREMKITLKEFREKKDKIKSIDQISSRLKEMITTEIHRSIQKELTYKQKTLANFASIVTNNLADVRF